MTLTVLLAAAVLIADSRLSSSLIAYLAFTAATLWLGYDPHASAAHLALFATIGAIKIVAGPLAILLLARRYNIPRTLAPSLNAPWRVAIVVAVAFAGYEIGQFPAFAGVPHADIVFYAIFASIATVVLHRNLLAHVTGLLALGSAISLAGAVFAPNLPGSLELAGTFDAVIATLVAVLVARALVAYDPNLDVRSLRELRG